MRLFAGFLLPSPAVERLSSLRLRLATPSDGLRWSTPEQWRVPLRLLGCLPDADRNVLLARAAAFHEPAPTLILENVGLFPAKGILYAGLDPSPVLTAFHQAFLNHIGEHEPHTNSLPFHPHITLARSKGRVGLKTLEKLGKPVLPCFGAPIAWTPPALCLYESTLSPQGASYRTVLTVPLPSPARESN